ncbi:MAG: hypothetical protein HY519_03180, partial [Candidatus Aenigmarchaeota archaeon]|nr:hypothetical protein [Candidatus Aenigmarchaeota archaeon]
MLADTLLIQVIALAYGAVGVIATIAYWPTVKDLLRNRPSANLESYLIWTLTTGVTFLYSIFVLPDFLFRMVSFLNFAACATIALLSVRLRG